MIILKKYQMRINYAGDYPSNLPPTPPSPSIYMMTKIIIDKLFYYNHWFYFASYLIFQKGYPINIYLKKIYSKKC